MSSRPFVDSIARSYGPRRRQDCGLSWGRAPTGDARARTRHGGAKGGQAMTGSTGGFELRGINHLALVCRDMERTVDFYTNVLGMPLVKTIELPAGHGTALLLRLWRRRLPRLLLVPQCARRRARCQRAGGPARPGRPHERHRLHEPRRLRRGAREDRGVPRPPHRRRRRLHRDREPRRLRMGHQRRDAPRRLRAQRLLPGPRRHPARVRLLDARLHPLRRRPRPGHGPGEGRGVELAAEPDLPAPAATPPPV